MIRNDPRHGIFFLDDFLEFHTTAAGSQNGRTVTQTTAGTVVEVDDEAYGVIAMSSSATVNQGVTMVYPGVTVIPNKGETIICEARVKLETVTVGSQLFFGLQAATDDTVAMAEVSDVGTPTSTSYVGLYTPSTLLVTFGTLDNSGTASITTGIGTMVAATYHKLGFRINGLDGYQTFFDGVEIANTNTVASIPDGIALHLTLANISEGTSTSVASFDWVALASLSA